MAINIEKLIYKVNVHMEYSSKQYLQKKLDDVHRELFDIADAWKSKAIDLLSVKATKARNTSKYPRFITKDLLSSLDFWIINKDIKKIKPGVFTSRIEVKRRFVAFQNARGFNYGEHLDEHGIGPYAGYKQRIYNILDKALTKAKLGHRR